MLFDFYAIQVMKNEKLQQLPEAVNKKIVKNSHEIVFEEEDKNFREKSDYIKRRSKLLSYNQKIFFEKDVLIQRAVEKGIVTMHLENVFCRFLLIIIRRMLSE